MPEFNIDIIIHDDSWHDEVADIESKTFNIISSILQEQLHNSQMIEVSLVLADDDFVQDLNKKYRHQNKPTNVLSFPQTEPHDLQKPQPFISLGDIIIALETMKRESVDQKKSFLDHYTHMLVHGCLHLLHFDHQDDKQAEEMESLEIHYLQDMGIKNPYERQ